MAVMTAFLVSPAPGDFHVPSAKAGMVCPEASVMVGPPTATLAFFAAGSADILFKDGRIWNAQGREGREGGSGVVSLCTESYTSSFKEIYSSALLALLCVALLMLAKQTPQDL